MSSASSPTQPAFRRDLWLPVLIVGVGLAAYGNSFAGVFVFDDGNDIVFREEIRDLWTSLKPQKGSNWRPVAAFSLALNYAVSGLDPKGFHAVNLAIHILAALALYGIVRRTLCLEPYRARFHDEASWLALAVALLWMVHPLQTESVTYMVQRYESLVGLFYLSTLYCVIRVAASESERFVWRVAAWMARLLGMGRQEVMVSKRFVWQVAAWMACLLGMGCKEVMVTAPVLMLLYDRIFLAGSWGEVIRRRWLLHAGLAATWLLLVPSIWAVLTGEVPWAGRATHFTPLEYALSESGVILHYLKLCFWPAELCLDYVWPVARTWPAIVFPGLAVLGLLLGTAWALWRIPWLGYLGAWFFLILAPTSSIMPLLDLAFEHRLYLSLAALAVLVVLAGRALLDWLCRRLALTAEMRAGLAGAALAATLTVLVWLTIERNRVYHDEERVFRDIVVKRPDNWRGHHNLADVLMSREMVVEASEHFKKAHELNPDYTDSLVRLEAALEKKKKFEEEAAVQRRALAVDPNNPDAHVSLGKTLWKLASREEAVSCYRKALSLAPENETYRQLLDEALK